MSIRNLLPSFAIALMAFCATTAQADIIELDLEYNTSTLTWDLFAEVITGGTIDGSNGLSAVRALIDNADFGTLGNAVNIASGIGAIDPVMTSSGPRDPVLQLTGGTLDIIYGQDISDAPSVVGGVGVGARVLIADGTFASAGMPPAFGMDGALASQGLFLDVAAPGPFGDALDPDSMLINPAVDVTPGFVLGDVDMNGVVDGLDIPPFIALVTGGGFLLEADVFPFFAPDGVVDGLDIPNFITLVSGGTPGPPLSGITAVPEPTTLSLILLGGLLACGRLGRSSW